ncbi:MAG: hypothetical protein QGH45_09635, partial [Myxococcota bacterium]|nr:hypothetical protein [Myxococcota bacterium]
ALSCEHDFVNERLGGLHHWLADLDADGSFSASFPNTPGDTVTGTYDVGTGALIGSVTHDEGYKLVSRTVEGIVTFDTNGDMTGQTTVTLTYLDGFAEIQERDSQQVGCVRSVSYTSADRHGDAVSVTAETTFTGPMTADEAIEGELGETTEISFVSTLNEDYSRDDTIEYDTLDTEPDPDQEVERTLLGDGSGSGSYVSLRDEGRVVAGTWDYYPSGDYEGDWEMEAPDAPSNPVAWGHTYHNLDLSGWSEYTRLGGPAGGEVNCVSEWDSDGSGVLDCDDGTHEEF